MSANVGAEMALLGSDMRLTTLVLLIGLGVVPPAGAADPRAVEFASHMLDALGVSAGDCPEWLLGELDPGVVRVCTQLELSRKEFKKEWQQGWREYNRGHEDRPEPVDAWRVEGNTTWRHYRLDIVMVGVSYDADSSWFALVYSDVVYCDSDEWREVARDLPQCDLVEGGLPPPEKVVCPAPRDGIQSAARPNDVDYWIELEATLRPDGTVDRVCVGQTIRKNFPVIQGFNVTAVQNFIERTRRREYDPATREGQPVAVLIHDHTWRKSGY